LAVGAYTYGTVDRVERLIGDIATGHQFGTSTRPNTQAIEGWLDDIASEMHLSLAIGQYTVQTAAVMAASYPLVSALLISCNSLGAAMLGLVSMSSEVAYSQDPEAYGNRNQNVRTLYLKMLKGLEGTGLADLGFPQTGGVNAVAMFSGVDTDPRFFRDWTHLSEPA